MTSLMTLKNCSKLDKQFNQTGIHDSSFGDGLEMTNCYHQTSNTRQQSSLGDSTLLFPKQSMNDTSLFDNTLQIPDPKKMVSQNY